MAQAVRQTQAAPRPQQGRWHNHLPAWITEDAGYRRLTPGYRQTLQAIADMCDQPDQHGSLLGAFGGKGLIQRIGCSRSTFWQHVKRLEALGFVVPIARGGLLGLHGQAGYRNIGNVYGIPGRRGGLDQRRSHREMRRMVRDQNGRIRRQVLRPGDQPTLWLAEELRPRNVTTHRTFNRGSPKVGLPVVRNSDWGSPEIGHHHHHRPSPLWKNHGACAEQRRDGARRRLRHCTPEDLADTGRLLRLYEDSVERGVAQPGEHGRLIFVGAAERALEEGRNPCALFADLVNRQRWMFVTIEHETRANERIKEYLYGDPRARLDG